MKIRTENEEFILDVPQSLRYRCISLSEIEGFLFDGEYYRVPANPETVQVIRDVFKGIGSVKADKRFQELMKQTTEPERSADPDLVETFESYITLWEHQARSVERALTMPGYILDHEVGTGKTISAIAYTIYGGFHKTIVFTKKRAISQWGKWIQKVTDGKIMAIPLKRGSIPDRVERGANAIHANPKKPWMLVINYESVARKGEMRDWLISLNADAIIFDECHKLKSPGGKTSMWVGRHLAPKIPHRLGMTGTLMPRDPLCIYGQARAIDPTKYGTNYTAFKSKYAVFHPEKKFPLYFINEDEHAKVLSTFSDHVRADDVLELPDRHTEYIEFDLPTKVLKVYRELEDEFVSWIRDNQGNTKEITIPNALVKVTRLQQLTGGYVKSDDGKLIKFHNAKFEALRDFMEDLPTHEQVIVFTQYTEELEGMRLIAEGDPSKRGDKGLGRRFGIVSGKVNDDDYESFVRGDIDFLAIQIQAGGEALDDLKVARYGGYYSPGFNGGLFTQSRGRLRREGQLRKIYEFRIVANDTIDMHVYRQFDRKAKIVNSIIQEAARYGREALRS